MDTDLIRKYNVPGPRYTSYPNVPFRDADSFSETIWSDRVMAGELPVMRGHALTESDAFIRAQILNSMCRFENHWNLRDWSEEEWKLLEAKLAV